METRETKYRSGNWNGPEIAIACDRHSQSQQWYQRNWRMSAAAGDMSANIRSVATQASNCGTQQQN